MLLLGVPSNLKAKNLDRAATLKNDPSINIVVTTAMPTSRRARILNRLKHRNKFPLYKTINQIYPDVLYMKMKSHRGMPYRITNHANTAYGQLTFYANCPGFHVTTYNLDYTYYDRSNGTLQDSAGSNKSGGWLGNGAATSRMIIPAPAGLNEVCTKYAHYFVAATHCELTIRRVGLRNQNLTVYHCPYDSDNYASVEVPTAAGVDGVAYNYLHDPDNKRHTFKKNDVDAVGYDSYKFDFTIKPWDDEPDIEALDLVADFDNTGAYPYVSAPGNYSWGFHLVFLCEDPQVDANSGAVETWCDVEITSKWTYYIKCFNKELPDVPVFDDTVL